MPQQFPDNPSPEVAAERERVLALIGKWQLSPEGAGVRSKTFTAITNGYSLGECQAKWGHPWTAEQ